MTVRELKQGEYFTKKQLDFPNENQVWIRGSYDKSLKKFECYRFSDVCDTCYLSGEKSVFTEFTF